MSAFDVEPIVLAIGLTVAETELEYVVAEIGFDCFRKFERWLEVELPVAAERLF